MSGGSGGSASSEKKCVFSAKSVLLFRSVRKKCYICIGFKGQRASPGNGGKLNIMKDFICNFWLFFVIVLAVVAYAYAIIAGGLQAFGGASIAFTVVVGLAFPV